jgi:hypothetical protein
MFLMTLKRRVLKGTVVTTRYKYGLGNWLLILLIGFNLVSEISFGQLAGSKERAEKNFQLLPIPYLNYSRSIGLSYGLLPLAMYNLNKKDTISPSSISGGLIMATTNGTWFGMGFSKFYFKEDKYRSTVAGGVGNVNFQFYPDLPILPEVVDYSTGADFFMFDLQRRIIEDMYLGAGYVYANLRTDFDINGNPVPTQTVELHGLRFIFSYDKRDDVYYPHSGFITNTTLNVFPSWMANANPSQNLEVDYNHFFGMSNEKDVVAARAYVGLGLGDISFNQQFIVGNTDIRGYSQGIYRGKQLYAIQGEYRWNIHRIIGLVGFAGVATLTGSQNESHNGLLLPAAGAGVRFNVFPKNHFNIGMDIGVGKEDWSLEFRIGEAF